MVILYVMYEVIKVNLGIYFYFGWDVFLICILFIRLLRLYICIYFWVFGEGFLKLKLLMLVLLL